MKKIEPVIGCDKSLCSITAENRIVDEKARQVEVENEAADDGVENARQGKSD